MTTFEDDLLSASTLDDGVVVVVVSGDVDNANAPTLQRALLTHLAEREARLVLELSDVPFMDSSGIGALIAAYVQARDRGSRLAVVVGSGPVGKRVRLMGLDTVIKLFASRDEALAAIRSG